MFPQITPYSLTAMQSIATGHPVYRVTVSGHNYVIKAETSASVESASDIKWASKIMNNVLDEKKTQDTKVRMLTDLEIETISLVYTRYFDGKAQVAIEEALGNASNVWCMMHYQPNLFIPDNMDDLKKAQLFSVINHGTFWKKFGKVVAVDLFTGNNDRFDFAYYEAIPDGQEDQFWSNKGNVFINVPAVGRAMPMGLDFFFSQNAFGKDLISDAAYIKIMSNKGEVAKIAALIIKSVMHALTGYQLGDKGNSKSSKKSKFTTKFRRYGTTADKYHAYLTDSIWGGLMEVRQYLLVKRKTYAATTPPVVFTPRGMGGATVPNHNPMRPGQTTPVAHNNVPVDKKVFPPNIEDRMLALKWI